MPEDFPLVTIPTWGLDRHLPIYAILFFVVAGLMFYHIIRTDHLRDKAPLMVPVSIFVIIGISMLNIAATLKEKNLKKIAEQKQVFIYMKNWKVSEVTHHSVDRADMPLAAYTILHIESGTGTPGIVKLPYQAPYKSHQYIRVLDSEVRQVSGDTYGIFPTVIAPR